MANVPIRRRRGGPRPHVLWVAELEDPKGTGVSRTAVKELLDGLHQAEALITKYHGRFPGFISLDAEVVRKTKDGPGLLRVTAAWQGRAYLARKLAALDPRFRLG